MRKKIKAVSLIVAASLILNMFGCAQKADATIAIAMGMFACTVRMDLAAGQSDGATGQDTYEQTANAETSEVKESVPVPTMTLEEALERMEYAKTDHFLVFEPEEGAALFYYASSQENAKDFTGTWQRTDVKSLCSGSVYINDQDESGFDVGGRFRFQSYKASIEGRAYLVTENLAILRVYNECAKPDEVSGETNWYEYVAFEYTEDGLNVYATARGDDLFGMFQDYCFAEGNYIQGDPFYTDVNILDDTYAETLQDEIKTLIGPELYRDCFVETTENGSLFIHDIVLEDGTQGKHYHAYSMGRETTLFYKIYVFDNGDIYGKIGKDRIFFSNVEGATEVPDYEYVEDGLMYG